MSTRTSKLSCVPPAAVRVFLAAAIALGACELPQDGKRDPSDAAGDTADAGGTPRSFRLLQLVDLAGTAPEDEPGADIDAVVFFRGDTFLAAGCAQATLFGAEAVHDDNPNLDPAKASLTVRNDSLEGGFVSLGGGTLVCELPAIVRTGDRVAVWEAEGDGRDRWRASLAVNAQEAFEKVGDFQGSATFVVP